jgi:hypothetical protein
VKTTLPAVGVIALNIGMPWGDRYLHLNAPVHRFISR